MKRRIYYPILFLLFSSPIMAQLPEDALRTSWIIPSGTARHQAIGGAMGSLGGEITTLFVNPAGLGMFKTGEFVISPGFSFLNSKSNFRGTAAKADKGNKFNFGTSGIVWGYSDRYSRWAGKAFSLAVNRSANFNSNIRYQGSNDYSSFAEPLANEFANSNLTIDQALNSPNISLLTKMALFTYLVDTATIGGVKQVIARSEQAGTVNQSNNIKTTGGITEVALGFAANMDDKLYLGLSLGVPILNYERNSLFREEDANGKGNNEFYYSSYNETYTSKGVGINGKLGLIFKPVEQVRLGLAIHTPTLYGLKDNLSAEMTTDIDTASGSVKVFTSKSTDFYNGQNPEFKYDLQSPWKIILSGSYVIHEVEDVTKQRGFVTADIEYTGHGSSSFKSADAGNNNSIYADVNKAIKEIYKGAFNFRAGGELKFKTIMARLGFAYYGNPYSDKILKARKMNLSGGLGYRNKGMFIDLTYVQSLNRDVHFPYRVDPPRQNTFATLKDSNGGIMITAGIKF